MAFSQKGNLAFLLQDSKKRTQVLQQSVELSESSLFMRYAVEHMRAVLEPGAILSLPPGLFPEVAQPVGEVHPNRMVRDRDAEPGPTYVQVVILHPSSMKTLRGVSAIQSDIMLATTLQCCPHPHDIVLVIESPARIFAYNFAHPANTREIWEAVQVYVCEASHFAFSRFISSHDVQQLLSQLLAHGALPRSGKACLLPSHGVEHFAATRLLAEGLIGIVQGDPEEEEEEEEAVRCYCITEEGTNSLVTCKIVRPLKPVLQRCAVNESDMSTFELLSLLMEKGWSWMLTPFRKRPLPYKAGERKSFYTRNRFLPRLYLLALLKADADEHPEQLLHHCQANSYYESFLAGTAGNEPPKKRSKVALPTPLEGGDGENCEDMAGGSALPNSLEAEFAAEAPHHFLGGSDAEQSLEDFVGAFLDNEEFTQVARFCAHGQHVAEHAQE